MATVPPHMLPKAPRRVLDMCPGEKADVGLYAFKVDPASRVLYLSNTTEINDPSIERTAELFLDDAGRYRVDWRKHDYEFKKHQLEDLEDWRTIGITSAGYQM